LHVYDEQHSGDQLQRLASAAAKMTMIWVPRVPPSPNELRRKYRHAHAYRRLREQWEHDLFYGVGSSRLRAELEDTAENVKMRVQITLYHSRDYDADNLAGCQKPILDALKNLHFIADDCSKKLLLLPAEQVKVARKEAKTLVKIGPADEQESSLPMVRA
jgi:Holliday junction resolvase RusA-like endonuclease